MRGALAVADMDATSSTQLALLWRACLRVCVLSKLMSDDGKNTTLWEADRSWEETVKDLSF